MSVESLATSAPGSAQVRAATRPGTVISPAFDLAFFILPPLLTAAFLVAQSLAPSTAFALCALVWVALAQSHFGATLFFYFDARSRAAYRARAGVYYVMPLVLVGGAAIAGFTPLAHSVLMLVPLVSFWHGNKQSVGVAGLYRGLTRSFDPTTRSLELAAIFSGSACFTSVGLVRLGMLDSWGVDPARIPAGLVTAWWVGLAGSVSLLGWALARAAAQSAAASVRPWPRLSVLLSSWAMYLPYLLAHDVLSAYLAALIPHYLQYHGLLWLVNRNKAADGTLAPRTLGARLVASPWRYGLATIGFALALGAVLVAAWSAGRPEAGLAVVAGVNLAHFWLDGFFWRFRDPLARERTLRYIRSA